jgi:hypothetical protein
VDHHHFAVRAELHIKLNNVGPVLGGVLKGWDGVLGDRCTVTDTSMGGNARWLLPDWAVPAARTTNAAMTAANAGVSWRTLQQLAVNPACFDEVHDTERTDRNSISSDQMVACRRARLSSSSRPMF